MVKIHAAVSKLYYINTSGQFVIRFVTQNELSDEFRFGFGINSLVFGETAPKIKDFFASENFLSLLTTENRLYVLNELNELTSQDLVSGDNLQIFRVEKAGPISSFAISRGSLYYISDEQEPFELKLNSVELKKRYGLFLGNMKINWLLLAGRPLQVFKKVPIKRIFATGNMIALEAETRLKLLEEYTTVETAEMFSQTGVRGAEKIVLHNKIDGRKIGSMSLDEIENHFVSEKRHLDFFRIVDEIQDRKIVRHRKPCLYLMGSNPGRHFGLGESINNFLEIELPPLDINEQIEDFVIGNVNTVLITNRNRVFMSVNTPSEKEEEKQAETPPRKDSKPGKKGKKQKGGNNNKDRDRRQQKNSQKEKRPRFEWVDVRQMITTFAPWQKKHLSIYFHLVKGVNTGFNLLLTPNYKPLDPRFVSARECLQYIREHKNINKRELVFLDHGAKQTFSYNEMLCKEHLLEGISAIKNAAKNKIIWSVYSGRLLEQMM